MPALGTLSIDMVAHTGKFVRQLRAAEREASFTARNVGRMQDTFAKNGASAGAMGAAVHVAMSAVRVALVAATATAVAFGAALKSLVDISAEFETSMARVGAVSGATDSQMNALRSQALAMSQTVAKSAADIASGQNFLAMAGLEVNEVLTAMPAVSKLSTIGMMDFGRASDIATNIMTGFGIGADEIGRVVDGMATTITSSNVNIVQLGEAMKMVAPVARAVSISIEETSAALGILGNAGQQGELGGTALRNIMLRLINPTKKSADLINFLGIEVKDAKGNFKSLVGIMKEFEKAGASTEDVAQIFGTRGGPAFLNLLAEGSNRLQAFTEAQKEAGVAARLEAEILATYEAQLKNLEGTFKAVAIAAGDEFKGALQLLMKELSSTITGVEDLDEKTRVFSQRTIVWMIEGLIETVKAMNALHKVGSVVSAMFKALFAIINAGLNVIAGGFTMGLAVMFTAAQTAAGAFLDTLIIIMESMTTSTVASIFGAEGIKEDLASVKALRQEIEPMLSKDFIGAAGKTIKELAADTKEGFAFQVADLEAADKATNDLVSSLEKFKSGAEDAFGDRQDARALAEEIERLKKPIQELHPEMDAAALEFAAYAQAMGNSDLVSIQKKLGEAMSDTSLSANAQKQMITGLISEMIALGKNVDIPLKLLEQLNKLDAGDSASGTRKTGGPKPPGRKGKDNRLARLRAEMKALKEMGDARFIDVGMQIKTIELTKIGMKGDKKRLALNGEMKKLLDDLTAIREKGWAAEAKIESEAAKKLKERQKLSNDMRKARVSALREEGERLEDIQVGMGSQLLLMADLQEIRGRQDISLRQRQALEAAAHDADTARLREKLMLEKELADARVAFLALNRGAGFNGASDFFGGLSTGLDSSIVSDTIAEKTKAEEMAHLKSTDMAAFELEQIKAGNQAWVERIEIMSELASTMGDVSSQFMEAAQMKDLDNRKAAQGIALMNGMQAIGGAVAAAFLEDRRHQAIAQGALNTALAIGAVLLGLSTGNVAAFAAGAGFLATGIGQFVSAGAAGQTQSEFDASSVDKKSGTDSRSQTRDAILDALKEAGLFRPDFANVEQNFFGSDPVSFQPGRRQARVSRNQSLEHSRSRI